MCFSGTNQKPERRRPFGTGLVRHCPQGLFSPFFTFLRALFFCPFRLSLFPTICPWVSEDGYSFVDDISQALFRRYLGPPQEEKERGLIYRTAASKICFCMYSTAFASISSTALEIEALSFAVNRFKKKTKEHSEPK